MSHTISVRLTEELAEWLQNTSRVTGIPRGKIIRDHLERAKEESAKEKPWMRLAGCVPGLERDLSSRTGFNRK